ncbi:thaumatin-like protein 1 [Heracleum sosnowskyi]|uniref:Thaumatin-like protein 1 n=1 Tax=Heracleum sosnowskyi TaxID=360622 RepID=A0AAD8HTK2_9APIA|nr:thaumatin-like protein 1 [Heracleum sosnowskyi]KAK1373009.1 thaumatin-like protein 1 [Heracleum sosnowskyi]
MALFKLFFALLLLCTGTYGAKFTFVNKCEYTVWPGILTGSGTPPLETTGFELPQQSSRSLQAPNGWSGRFWGRTGCKFNGTGPGSCSTADCGSGQVECNGAGAAPPATLAEFTLGSGSQGSQDFYDVSLVDGYNLPMIVEASGGSSGMCAATGCVTDLNKYCPDELKVSNGDACKSACEAFGKPEYCCSGAHNTPETCKPSAYAAIFKMACPRAYSYAYDDLTSTFTCTGADYTITFCTSIPTSHTAVVNATPSTTNGNEQQAAMSSAPSPGTSGSGSGPEPEPMMRTSGSSDSRRNHSLSTLQFLFIASAFIFFF